MLRRGGRLSAEQGRCLWRGVWLVMPGSGGVRYVTRLGLEGWQAGGLQSSNTGAASGGQLAACLNPLRGIHQQQRPLARRQRARHLRGVSAPRAAEAHTNGDAMCGAAPLIRFQKASSCPPAEKSRAAPAPGCFPASLLRRSATLGDWRCRGQPHRNK